MEITQRDIETTARIMWNSAAESAARSQDLAAPEFNRLATKYSALALLFCGRHEDTELLFDWLIASARAMADHYYHKNQEAA